MCCGWSEFVLGLLDSKADYPFTTLLDFFIFRNLIESYSATLNYRSEHGDKKTDDLITKCISNIGKALGKSNEKEASVHVDVSNEFFMVLCRKPE